jgi:hypothetical protein
MYPEDEEGLGTTKIKFIDVLEKFGNNQKSSGGFDEMLALRPVL